MDPARIPLHLPYGVRGFNRAFHKGRPRIWQSTVSP